MKKYLFIPVSVLALLLGVGIFSTLSAVNEEQVAMEKVIRLHVRAADDSAQEQALKLKVRDEILNCTSSLLENCTDKNEARACIEANLSKLKEAGQAVVDAEGCDHIVSVSLERETFEYREYDGFFLPEGEYDSLIVNIGPAEGQNWWCVVFPAACYMGASDTVETDAEKMPSCFRIAKGRRDDVTVEWWFWNKLKEWFS